ncbi:unnamed protein product, partial [Allacma fusca]
ATAGYFRSSEHKVVYNTWR